MRTENKFGFTLAELLAVVLIMAILTILAAGSYRKSVEQSRFSEGLAAASALAESLNRYYIDRRAEGATDATIRNEISQMNTRGIPNRLDISLPAQNGCSTFLCSKFFSFRISSDEVSAQPRQGRMSS